MKTKTRSKDAARTRSAKPKAGSGERLKKAAQAEIAGRLKKLDAGEAANHNEQGSPAAPKKPKLAKKIKGPKQPKPKCLSVLDAAAQVIATLKEPVGCKALIAKVVEKDLWKSPKGKTPDATLYAAIIREIAAKGRESRFKKHDRGLFVAAPHGRVA